MVTVMITGSALARYMVRESFGRVYPSNTLTKTNYLKSVLNGGRDAIHDNDVFDF